MSGFNYLLLIPAGFAVLLFLLLLAALARRTRNEEPEPADAHPAANPEPSPATAASPPTVAPTGPFIERPPFEPWRLVERLLAKQYQQGLGQCLARSLLTRIGWRTCPFPEP